MCLSVIIMYSLRPIAERYNWKRCEFGMEAMIEDDEPDCFGQVSVLRMSFSLTAFHLIMLIILVPRAACSGALHDGLWPLKYLIVVGIYVGAWFIDKQFFVVWGHLCRAFSILFLFVQSYFLMNVAYLWNDYLMAAMRDKEGSDYAKFLLLGFSILSTIGNVTSSSTAASSLTISVTRGLHPSSS